MDMYWHSEPQIQITAHSNANSLISESHFSRFSYELLLGQITHNIAEPLKSVRVLSYIHAASLKYC